MKLLNWLKENIFDPPIVSPVPGSCRPSGHHPGWKNIQRGKKRGIKTPKRKSRKSR